LRKFNAIRFENVRFWEKPSLYALKTLDFEKKTAFYAFKTLNFKLTLPSLGYNSSCSVPFAASITLQIMPPLATFPPNKLAMTPSTAGSLGVLRSFLKPLVGLCNSTPLLSF
jgi:hypothetical protein